MLLGIEYLFFKVCVFVYRTIGYKKPYVSVPKGHCWIEGDHRGKSYDSNRFGPVSIFIEFIWKHLLSKIIGIIYNI